MRTIVALFLIPLTLLAEHPLGGAAPPSSYPQAVALLAQPQATRRTPAIVRLRADGKAAQGDYQAALARTEPAALGVLRRQLQVAKPTDASFTQLMRDLAEWKTAAETARVLVQTDHHKDARKFAEMDKAFAAAEKAHEKIARQTRPGAQSMAGQFLDALLWVAEIRRDLRWCEGKEAPVEKVELAALLEAEGAGPGLLDFARAVEPIVGLRELHRCITTIHGAQRWARREVVDYAELLNARRVVLGLRPYLLSQQLSDACLGHSEEMVKLKYFAHESPVPENKTPWDRARNAKFEGNALGECIYSGSSAGRDAHQGWWYSDGHRLILYSKDGDAQGVGKFGSGMWTFCNGKFTTFGL